MTVTLKDAAAISAMRRAGRVVAEMHEACRELVRPGVTTAALDEACAGILDRRGATSNFLGYPGVTRAFPGVLCASPNDVVVHGFPDDRPLSDGDLLSVDTGAVVDGWHADAAITIAVGEVDDEARALIAATEAALEDGIAAAVAGSRIGDVGHAVQARAEAAGFEVVREYAGHGIGREMHEDPAVPSHGRRGSGLRIRIGLCIAIEPIVVAGSPRTHLRDDGWTVVTADGSRAAHFEHSVAVTADGPVVLTAP
ncbi:MAG: type I methionyl aminopeptidase [Acidimicrobiia bacterium]|nr:type I methionyl aminopeptidase [Acidimicrobiia bacterium]